ncbi:hypothetical protein HBA_0511 [Sodalis endosymbiont of Henestaris halophilus]|nr:hypothetical protein HBA_0511 [Sodalis endosymbiont of Henestaris halophilus]
MCKEFAIEYKLIVDSTNLQPILHSAKDRAMVINVRYFNINFWGNILRFITGQSTKLARIAIGT